MTLRSLALHGLGWVAAASTLGCVGDAPVGPGQDGSADNSVGDVAAPDSGDAAGDGGDGAVTFSPSSFGNDLALWVIGDQVSETGGMVDTWPDQSPHHTDLTQTDAPSRPLHEKGVLNGHDIVDFNGNGVSVVSEQGDAGSPANLSFGQNDDFVVAAVIATAAGGQGSGFVWLKAGEVCNGSCILTTGFIFGADIVNSTDDSPAARIDPNDTYLRATNVLSDHSYHVVVARRIGQSTLQLRTDTVVKQATVTAADVSMPSARLTVGSGPTLISGSFAFRVAELVAVHRTGAVAINDNDVASLEAYLKAKYKTP